MSFWHFCTLRFIVFIINLLILFEMEPDMYYITEVDDKTYSNVSGDGTNRKRKKRIPLKVTNVEKRILAKLIEQEPVIWDTTNEFHTNNTLVLLAWSRIASEMPGRNVPQCKLIWRSLKDAIRYRQKKVEKNIDNPEDNYEYEQDFNWEFSDCMSFLMQSKRPRRSNPMTMENADSSELENNSFASNAVEVEPMNQPKLRISSVMKSTNSSSVVDERADQIHDDSSSESNYYYSTNAKKKEQDPLAESVISISNSIRDLVKSTIDDRREKSTLKFDYIWHNLDKLFQKLPDEAVDELNVRFIQMAFQKIPKG